MSLPQGEDSDDEPSPEIVKLAVRRVGWVEGVGRVRVLQEAPQAFMYAIVMTDAGKLGNVSEHLINSEKEAAQ